MFSRGVGSPFVIGVAGASASGKTTVCDLLIRGLNHHRCMLMTMDWFYHGLPEGYGDPSDYNFDHPDAIDFVLMRETLTKVINRERVQVPVYDFGTVRREHC